MAEDDGAEGPDEEPGPEHEEAGDQRQRWVHLRREEVLAEEERENAVEIKVVPLDERAHRRGADDEGQIDPCGMPGPGCRGYCHMRFPSDLVCLEASHPARPHVDRCLLASPAPAQAMLPLFRGCYREAYPDAIQLAP